MIRLDSLFLKDDVNFIEIILVVWQSKLVFGIGFLCTLVFGFCLYYSESQKFEISVSEKNIFNSPHIIYKCKNDEYCAAQEAIKARLVMLGDKWRYDKISKNFLLVSASPQSIEFYQSTFDKISDAEASEAMILSKTSIEIMNKKYVYKLSQLYKHMISVFNSNGRVVSFQQPAIEKKEPVKIKYFIISVSVGFLNGLLFVYLRNLFRGIPRMFVSS